MKKIKKCLNCNSILYKKHSWCSLVCQRTYKKMPINCLKCGKELGRKATYYCSRICKGKVNLSEETKSKISKSLTGHKYSEERNKKMIDTLEKKYAKGELKQWNDGETKFTNPKVAEICEKMRQANIGRIQPKEERLKRSISRINDLKSGKIKINSVSKSEIYFGQKMFETFNIELEHSFMLEGRCFDYKIPGKKILIECDGSYWHSKPENIANDILKNNIAKKHNYKLYRFKIDFNKDVDRLIDKDFNILKKIIYES